MYFLLSRFLQSSLYHSPLKSHSIMTERDGGIAARCGAEGGAQSNLGDRLVAISREQGGEKPTNRGEWLEREHKRLLEDKGLESDSEPTEELIIKQVMLPNKEMVDRNKFREPITIWVNVDKPSDFCLSDWSREGLPEEEVVRPPDWRPPTPPRDDTSLITYIDPSKKLDEKELRAKMKKVVKVYGNKIEVFNDRTLREGKEIAVYDAACIIRITKKALEEHWRKADQEMRDLDRRGGRNEGFGGRGGRGSGRGGRGEPGGRGGGRGREEDNANYAKLGDRSRRRDWSQSSSPGRFSPRGESSRSNDHPSRRDRSRSRDRDRRHSSSSYIKKPSAYDRSPSSSHDRTPSSSRPSSSAYDRPSSSSRNPSAYDRHSSAHTPSRAPSAYDRPGLSSSHSRMSSTSSTGSVKTYTFAAYKAKKAAMEQQKK